jgi:hypothetical protein
MPISSGRSSLPPTDTLLRCTIFSGRGSAAGHFPSPSFMPCMESLAPIADIGDCEAACIAPLRDSPELV